ncbi:MAG TPA: sialidase family protein [Candidatus Thermoplasmatota archaeon]|jgi:hypothetical protein|nr:sialidase family protein [Candidatus Thermoplasmatota archaeon]
MRALLAAAMVVVVLAGCLTPAEPVPVSLLPGPGAVPALVAHVAGTLAPVPAAWQELRVRMAPTGFERGEPTLGVTSSGAIFTIAGNLVRLSDVAPVAPPTLPAQPPLPVPTSYGPSVARSLDHGLTWERLYDPAFSGKVDLDPWVWVDPETDRVFHAPLYVACSWVAWSDDEGSSWLGNPLGGCGLPGHDHQKLTSGPPPEGVQTTGYENVVYYAYNSFRGEGTVALASLNGGLTWGLPVTVHAADNCYGGLNGPVTVDADGRAYLAKATCDGIRVAVSDDAGQTWDLAATLTDGGVSPHSSINPRVAIDQAGNAYLLWNGADNLQRLAVSHDRGATWGAAMVVPRPDLKGTLFGVLAAGAEGKVVVGYLGTTSDPAGWGSDRDPSEATDDAVWHLYITFTDDALAAEPTFVTAQVTPDDDPVQRGCIWLRGGSNPCRNLRDFMDLVQRDGRVYVVYPDGCHACASAEESHQLGESTVAIVEEGPSLLGGALAALVPR